MPNYVNNKDLLNDILNDLRKEATNKSIQNPGVLSEIKKAIWGDPEFNEGVRNVLKGAVHEALRVPVGALNAMGYNAINPVSDQPGVPFMMGRAIPAIATGMLAGGIGSAISKTPAVARYAPDFLKTVLSSKNIIPSIARMGLGGAAYEGTANYEDRLGGALTGLAAGTLGGAIIPMAKGAGKLLISESPNNMARNIIEGLGHGAQNLEENSKRFLMEDLRHGAALALNKAKDLYNIPLKEAKNINIPKEDIEQIFKNVNVTRDDLLYSKTGTSGKKAYDRFFENPTLSNIHWLQSAIGKDATKFTDIKDISKLEELRYKLMGYMRDKLIASEGGLPLAEQYNLASDVFKKEYIPYLESKAASRLMGKQRQNLPLSRKNMYNLFGAPDESTLKVLEDIGDIGKERLLYSKLGGLLNKKNIAQELVNTVPTLERDLQSNLVTPYFKNQMENLEDLLYQKQLLKYGAGLGAAGLGYLGYKHNPLDVLGH